MLSYYDLRRGVQFILEGRPYEVLEFQQMKKAQREGIAQTRIKNLISGKVLERNFHQSDTFEEAHLEKVQIKFLFNHRGKFCFSESADPSKRFESSEEQIGPGVKFLKPGQVLTGIKFEGKIINILLPIKVQLKVIESPPGVKGDSAQGATKTVKLETGAEIAAPLFIENGNIVEVNTEKGEYVRRVE